MMLKLADVESGDLSDSIRKISDTQKLIGIPSVCPTFSFLGTHEPVHSPPSPQKMRSAGSLRRPFKKPSCRYATRPTKQPWLCVLCACDAQRVRLHVLCGFSLMRAGGPFPMSSVVREVRRWPAGDGQVRRRHLREDLQGPEVGVHEEHQEVREGVQQGQQKEEEGWPPCDPPHLAIARSCFAS